MPTSKPRTLTLLLGLELLLVFATPALSQHETNGGNYVEGNFMTWARVIHAYLAEQAPSRSLLDETQLAALAAAVAKTTVEAVPGPLTDNDGRRVNARWIYTDASRRTKKIQVEQEFWEAASGSDPGICRLVLHEYLRLIFVADDDYAVSSRLQTRCDYQVLPGTTNMGFEQVGAFGIPTGWEVSGYGFAADTDTYLPRAGVRIGRVYPVLPGGTFGSLTQCITAEPLRGKAARLSGYLRTFNVTLGYAGLWLRIDGPRGETLAFDNMQDRGLTGTRDWTPAIVDLPVARAAQWICFGALTSGTGTMWVDALRLDAQ
jgi:hypothetical protein